MDTEETPQQATEEAGENRGTDSGLNTGQKYVNGEVDNMPQQQCILTTLAPLDMAVENTTVKAEGQAKESQEKLPSAKQKRDSHNEIERRRKCKINIGIIKLGEIIPSCINAKLSKNQILEHAANHILDLTAKCEKLLTSSASETQAEEIKHLMKENERLRGENKRFQELMKTLQIPPNGVANPTSFIKGKGKKADKLIAISKSTTSTSGAKPLVTNTARVMTTTQNVTIMPSTNQIAGVNQVGTNQVVNQPGVGNAILVQNPNGGYFLVPTNNKNVTINMPNNQGPQTIAPNTITVVSSASGQVVNSSDGSNQATLGQTTMTTTSAATTTVTTQAVSTPIASAAQQGAVVQAPGGMQTIRYLVPMMPGNAQNQNQNTTQTVMVMAKPNNQPVPIRIAPQQPIRIASSQPQVILPQPAPVATSPEKNDSKKKSSPPKIKNLCSTDGDSDKIKTSGNGNSVVTTNAVTPNQVVLQRPPIQATSVAQGGVNQNVVTMQVVPPKPVSQQLVYIQQNGQLIPVVIQNPNNQGTTVIQQPQQQQQQQQVVTIPINQGQGMINNKQVVVVSQASGVMSSQGTSVITSSNNTNTMTTAGMTPLTVVTSQSGRTPVNNTDDILAKAAESIFSPNTLNDNSPTITFNDATETGASPATTASTSTPASGGSLSASLPPFPVAIQRADDPVSNYLKTVDQPEASPTDSHGKKQKKSKKKKKKKEKNKEKSKDKSKEKSKEKEKKKKSKHKDEDHKDEDKNKVTVKAEEDNTMIKELDRGIANSVDALPDSTSGTAIITDTLLQEWIEKEAGLTTADQDGDSRGETITNVTANEEEKDAEEPMDSQPVQNSTTIPSNYSAEALLAGSNDTPQTSSTPTVPTTATNTSTPTTTSGENSSTTNSQTAFGSFPSFSFGSDIMSSAMSVSGLPTYIEDEQSDEGKTSNSNGGLNSLKALGSMRDSILSFAGSQTNTTQASTPQTQSNLASNLTNSNQESKDNASDGSRSPSPAPSLPMDSSPPPAPAPPPERDTSSPESTHGFSASPEPPNMFGSTSNLLSDTLESKDSSQAQDDEIDDAPPPSPFPAQHNSSWISHHSRASHLASGLKKQKPPAASTSLPIPTPVVTTSSTTTTTSSENPANIPPGFYTLPWLGPPLTTSTSSSSRVTPAAQVSSNLESSPSEKPSIPRPTYLPTQESTSPSYAPNQHSSSSSTSYAPTQRSSSPTYVPPPHRTSPPSYFPKVSSHSLTASSPLTVDTSVAHPIFSSSSQLNTPTGRSVITTAHQPTSVTTSSSNAKSRHRPPLTKTKFSPSTIHRTLTSGITEEDSPEKTDDEPKAESQRPPKEQQREWQHKLPMQIKPGPDIRSKDGLVGTSTLSAQPAPLVKSKSKRSKKKKMAALAAAAAAKEAAKDQADGDKSHLEDIGKRELPKNLVVQFPWLAEAEENEKKAQEAAQRERISAFSIKSITQQITARRAEPLAQQKAITTPSSRAPPSSTNAQSKVTSSYSQSHGSSSSTPLWNPSTTDTYPPSTESTTPMTSSKQMPEVSAPLIPPSKSRIEYMPRQSPNSFNPNLATSTMSHNQMSPVSMPHLKESDKEKQVASPDTLSNYRGSGGDKPVPSSDTLPNFRGSGDERQVSSPGSLPNYRGSTSERHMQSSDTLLNFRGSGDERQVSSPGSLPNYRGSTSERQMQSSDTLPNFRGSGDERQVSSPGSLPNYRGSTSERQMQSSDTLPNFRGSSDERQVSSPGSLPNYRGSTSERQMQSSDTLPNFRGSSDERQVSSPGSLPNYRGSASERHMQSSDTLPNFRGSGDERQVSSPGSLPNYRGSTSERQMQSSDTLQNFRGSSGDKQPSPASLPNFRGSGNEKSPSSLPNYRGSGSEKQMSSPGSLPHFRGTESERQMPSASSLPNYRALGGDKHMQSSDTLPNYRGPGSEGTTSSPGSLPNFRGPGSEKEVSSPGTLPNYRGSGNEATTSSPGSLPNFRGPGSEKEVSSPGTLPNFRASVNERQIPSPGSLPNYKGSGTERQMTAAGLAISTPTHDHQQNSDSRSRKPALQRNKSSFNQKQSHQGETPSSLLSSPPDSSSSTLFPDFQLGGIPPHLMPNSGMDSRTIPTNINQKQDSSPRIQMGNQNSPQQPASRSSALPTPPSDSFLFSPTGSSSSNANQSSVFSNPGTNRSSDNQPEGDDFMTLAQAEKSLDFLPSSSPDQSQNVDAIDLTAMFDTPAGTPASTPSSIHSNVQSSSQSQRQHQQQQQQQQQQQMSGRTSADRQPVYGQTNIRPNHPSHAMYAMSNTAHRPPPVTSSHSMTSQAASQNRFMPSPEMHHPNPGTKRPASDIAHPQPSPKRAAAGAGGMPHHNQLPMPLMQGHEPNRGVVLERAPPQTSHIHRVDQGMHRGQTPPSTAAQQVGSPHSTMQHNQRSVERQPSSGPEISRVPTYDLSQRVGAQRNRPSDMVQTSRQEATRTPSYDLTQNVAPQRNRSVERHSETRRTPTYDLSQSVGAQRSRSIDHRQSETQRIPTYDLTQSASAQRNRSVERPTSGPEAHRTPVYDLPHGRNPAGRHQQARSETQRVPTFDLSQSASVQRTRSTERPTSASETQRIPTYDLTQSPHREPVQPPKQQRKRQQNNTEQYFPSSSDNTNSLRHMDSSIAQESNPWSGFPSQRMASVPSSEPSLSSPPFLPNFSQSLPSSMSQSESVNTSSSASIVPSISPSRRIRSDMPTYLPHPHLAPILSSPPQASKGSIGREAEISTPFNPMFPPAHTRAGLGMNVTPNFPSVFHEHPHQHAPPPFNVAKAQLPAGVGVHAPFNFNIFNEVPGPNTSHSDTPGLPVHSMHHLHGNPGMSVEDSMAHMRSNVQGRHVHGHPQFGNNMRIDSLLGQNVSADGRTFKVGVSPMAAPFHSFGPGMPF